jgi:hypothetical protein
MGPSQRLQLLLAATPPPNLRNKPDDSLVMAMAEPAATALASMAAGFGASPGTSPPPQSSRQPDGPAPASQPTGPEAALRRRRLEDLTFERDSLLQQLDDHVTACLSYSGSSAVSGYEGAALDDAARRGRGSNEVAGRVQAGRVPPGLVVKVSVHRRGDEFRPDGSAGAPLGLVLHTAPLARLVTRALLSLASPWASGALGGTA